MMDSDQKENNNISQQQQHEQHDRTSVPMSTSSTGETKPEVESNTEGQEARPKKGRRRPHTKTARACINCHKVHMTCDESRPCKRCVQRGLADTCVDAPRKKKKYLVDMAEAQSNGQWSNLGGGIPLQHGMDMSSGGGMSMTSSSLANGSNTSIESNSAHVPSTSSAPSPLSSFQYKPSPSQRISPPQTAQSPPVAQHQHQHQQQGQQGQANFSLPSINNIRRTPFLSDAADLEYAVLGNIINDNNSSASMSPHNYVSSDEHFNRPIGGAGGSGYHHNTNNSRSNSNQNSPMSFQAQYAHQHSYPHSDHQHQHPQQQQQQQHMLYRIPAPPSQPKPQYEKRRSTTSSAIGTPQQQQSHQMQDNATPPISRQDSLYSETMKYDTAVNQYYIGPVHGINEEISESITFPDVIDKIRENEKLNPRPKSFFNSKSASISFSIGLTSEDEYNRKVVDQQNIQAIHGGLKFREPSEIYSKIMSPFSYYPGYHQLLNYLTSRFTKKQLFSMAKTMAEYRPSFIAATCNLKEDDLIFMEKCFQRTLLEYDNYISISGTPTLVWRRTGQIAYVGNEFSILTGWTKQQLLNKITLLVELLDDQSVLEYFQLFNKIAFADFTGASMSECTLISPTRQKIRCRCLITLKRDVFGIPMMIIGNFLPILAEYGEVEE